jgi:hypothetical protein
MQTSSNDPLSLRKNDSNLLRFMYKGPNSHSDVLYQASANMYNLSTEVIFMDYWLSMSDKNGFCVISGVTVHRILCYASLSPNILRQKNVVLEFQKRI